MDTEPHSSHAKSSHEKTSQEPSIESEISKLTSDEKNQLIEALEKIPNDISRRRFLVLLSVPTLYISINAITRGLLHYWVGKLITDNVFRQKIVQELQDEGIQGIIQAGGIAYESRSEITESTYSLTEVTSFREEWMDRSFQSTQIFTLSEMKDAKTIFSEDAGGWKRVENHEGQFVAFFEISKVSVRRTIETQAADPSKKVWYEGKLDSRYLDGNFIALPAPQSASDGNPAIYTTFIDDGQLYEYGDVIGKNVGGRSTDRGAYVLDSKGVFFLANAEEQATYTLGENCQLIQHLPYVISSDSIEETYKEMDVDVNESGSVTSNSAEYPSAVGTFYDKDGGTRTFILSLYNYVSEDKKTFVAGNISGTIAYELFTIREFVEVAKAYAHKAGSVRFTVGFGDPAYSDVRVVNDQISPKELASADEKTLAASPTLQSLRSQLDLQPNKEKIIQLNEPYIRTLGGYGAERGGYRFHMYDYQMKILLLAHK